MAFSPGFMEYLLDKVRENAKSFAEINKKMDISDMQRSNIKVFSIRVFQLAS